MTRASFSRDGNLPEIKSPTVLKTEELLRDFEAHYNSFLEGFTADLGGVQPGAFSGATLKSYTAMSPRRPTYAVDFESNYRPSQTRHLRSHSAQGFRANSAQGFRRGVTPIESTHPADASDSRPQTSNGFRPQTSNSGVSTAGSKVAVNKGSERSRNKKPDEHGKDLGKDQGELDHELIAQEEAEALTKKREACESMRMLVFGQIGNEHLDDKHKASLFQQRRGTNSEVEALCDCWSLLDSDGSGDVDFDEFISYFNKRRVDRLLGMRCVRYLMPKASGGKGCVTLEDMMRLIWLCATDEDVQHMTTIFHFYRLKKVAVKPPKLLKRKRRDDLLATFQDLDQEKTGSVPYIDLVNIGIVDHPMMCMLREKYDKNWDGCFDQEEFLEMLAPLGCRAHKNVKKVAHKDGRCMRAVEWGEGEYKFEGWLLEEDYDMLRTEYNFPDD